MLFGVWSLGFGVMLPRLELHHYMLVSELVRYT